MAGTKREAKAADKPATMRRFCDGGGIFPGFRFQRTWWEGEGPRTGIAEAVQKKLRPGDDPQFGHAARYEVLIPDRAPGEYMAIGTLLERYDEMLPSFGCHAYAQITIDLEVEEPIQVGYERVRRYARSFVDTGLAVILVLHVPSMALSANLPHCHLMVPARVLTGHGFGAAATALCSDPGNREAWQAWQQHLPG